MSIKRYILNHQIKAKEVRVIDDEGKQVGILDTSKAVELAESKDLDLLLVTEEAQPPVCRIVNFGQYKYQQSKKEKQARKANKSHVIKELKMSPKISDNDYQVRVNRGKEFLTKGYKVKGTVWFRGREIVHSDLGLAVLQRFVDALEEYGTPDSEIMRGPRQYTVILSSKTK